MIGWIIIGVLIWLFGICPALGFLWNKIRDEKWPYWMYVFEGIGISAIIIILIVGIIFIIKGI